MQKVLPYSDFPCLWALSLIRETVNAKVVRAKKETDMSFLTELQKSSVRQRKSLACVTLLIATTSVIKANGKTITMMKVFGYEAKECAKAVLGGYKIWAYMGFAVGTVYQYALLKIAVEVIFADMEGVPDYQFDVPAMIVTLIVFVVLYEGIMQVYTKKMEKISVKETMLE